MTNYLKYCNRCILPETKPDLEIDAEGVCSACRYYETRPEIDWDKRQQKFHNIIDRYRSKDGKNYDCIVPVSGGKDSTRQVLTLLNEGIKPLCVVATTCQLSDIGRRNLDNLKSLGVDCLEFSTNPKVRATLNRIGLFEVGDISWPEHVSIFTVPPRVAVQFNIPLMIWGENSQHEYGGPAENAHNNVLDRSWLEEFGGLLGLRVSDLVGLNGLTQQDLNYFTYPTQDDLDRVGVTGLFLGYYFPWDGYSNALLSQAYGFSTLENAIEGSLVNYENLDNVQTGIHDYFKWLKYGFCRVADIGSMHVRRGRMTREELLDIARQRDGKFPWTYLGYPIGDVLDQIEIDLDQFIDICDRFTNTDIFETDTKGRLIKDNHGNLTKVNYDNTDA